MGRDFQLGGKMVEYGGKKYEIIYLNTLSVPRLHSGHLPREGGEREQKPWRKEKKIKTQIKKTENFQNPN